MEGPESEYVVRRPALPVAAVVERYVGYRMVGYPAGVHRGLPSRHLTFIVSIGPPIDVVSPPGAAQAPGRYRAVVGGLQSSPALIAHDGHQEGVEIELTPVGCRRLLGLPARALWSTTVELDDLVGPLGTELWERLQPTTAWDQRFAVCDEVLGRLAPAGGTGLAGASGVAGVAGVPGRPRGVAAELRRSWDLLVASRGGASVADLARDVGWSRQHLTRRFRDEFGLSPKLAGRIVRFERARRMLQSTPPHVSIAQVAATCGYYDQAHLTRDFTELAGTPPGRWLAEEELPAIDEADLPSVQDGAAPAGAR